MTSSMPALPSFTVTIGCTAALSVLFIGVYRKFFGASPLARFRHELAPIKQRAISKENAGAAAGKSIVAIVNPHSGSKQGLPAWVSVSEALGAHGANVRMLKSAHANHELELAAEVAEEALDEEGGNTVVVVVGGDGFFHNVCQGLLRVPECLPLVQLLHLPCGTGNGIATSLGVRTLKDAAEALLAEPPNSGSMDLLVVRRRRDKEEKKGPRQQQQQQQQGDDKHAALTVTYGSLADFDFLAEGSWRWLGPVRVLPLQVMIVARWATYRARLTFVLHPTDVAAGVVVPGAVQEAAGGGQWSLETDFFSINICNVPWCSTDCMLSPRAKCADGIVHLTMVRSQQSRFAAVKALLAVEQEATAHQADPAVMEQYRCLEVGVEPLNPAKPGVFAIDGEAAGSEPCYVSGRPKALRVIGGAGWTDGANK